MSEPVTRREMDILRGDADREHDEFRKRLDALDKFGTGGVIALQVQVTHLTEQMTTVKNLQVAHQQHHEDEDRRRRSARWKIAGLVVGAVAAVDGPLVTLLLARR